MHNDETLWAMLRRRAVSRCDFHRPVRHVHAVYMATRADWMEKGGEISGIISGIKFYCEQPEDLNDLK